MKCPAGWIVLFSLLRCRTDGLYARNPEQNSTGVVDAAMFVDLSAAIRRVDGRFLSVTIDASLATDEKFMYLLGWVSPVTERRFN